MNIIPLINSVFSEWYFYIKFVPLSLFLAYARRHGMTTKAWHDAFILGGVASAIIIAILLLKKVTLDRLMLGVNLFFFVGVCSFLIKFEPIINLYGQFKGAALLGNVVVVGVVSILTTQAGFIGSSKGGRGVVFQASLKLLLASIAGFTWSILTNHYGLFISGALPFIALKLLQRQLIDLL